MGQAPSQILETDLPADDTRPWLPTFSIEIADDICNRIIEGETLREICALPEMPSKATILKWAFVCPRWSDQYARARELSGESDADDVAYYARQAGKGELDAKQASAAIMGLKWTAGQRRSKVYGANARRLETDDEAGNKIAVYNSPSQEGDD